MKKIVLYFSLLILFIKCNSGHDYCRLFSVSSPKGDNCLTFLEEYDGDDLLKNNRTYLLGFNPKKDQVFLRHPDSNYLALPYYEMEGISVIWNSNKTIVYSCTKELENKLDSNSNFLFLGELPDGKSEEFYNDTVTHKSYFFEHLYKGKYKSCD